jgi:hypothetical protein
VAGVWLLSAVLLLADGVHELQASYASYRECRTAEEVITRSLTTRVVMETACEVAEYSVVQP